VSDALASLDDAGEAGLESVADEPAPSTSGPTDVPTAVRVLTYLVKALVAHPDDVRVEVIPGRPLQLGVRVAAGDLGRVIGKRGRNADAIRTLVRAAASIDGAEIDVEFLD
jgi:predicted RNA-binding protein YlqC (UPF0109 family)